MEFIQLEVERRDAKGSSASRRLRRAGKVPANLYGLGRPNADLTIGHEALEAFLKTGSRLVELRLAGLTQRAMLREVTHDPLTDAMLHVDLLRIDEHHEIEAEVEFAFKGLAKGLAEGGVFEPVLSAVKVRCTPTRLPKALVVDVSGLGVDDAVTIKDVVLPEGVVILDHRPDDHVCHVVMPRVVSLEPAATEGSPTEPERIGGKKPDDEEAAAEGGKGDKGDKGEKSEKKDKK